MKGVVYQGYYIELRNQKLSLKVLLTIHHGTGEMLWRCKKVFESKPAAIEAAKKVIDDPEFIAKTKAGLEKNEVWGEVMNWNK